MLPPPLRSATDPLRQFPRLWRPETRYSRRDFRLLLRRLRARPRARQSGGAASSIARRAIAAESTCSRTTRRLGLRIREFYNRDPDTLRRWNRNLSPEMNRARVQ